MARLLLVDDDIAEISAVKRVLARAGLSPVLATNASDAQAAMGQRLPDLLVVGATCEGGEALALVARLEDDEATRGLPLLVLGTGPGVPAHAVTLPRPVDPAALAEQVQALLAAGRRVVVEETAAPTWTPAPTATWTPAPPAPSPRLPFERRGPPIELPKPLERRSNPSDPARARQAAAEALRARAEELRRSPEESPSPAAAEAAAGLDALFELEPPAGVDPAARVDEPSPAPGSAAGRQAAPDADLPPAPPATWDAPAGAAVEEPLAETPFDLPPDLPLTSAMFEEPQPDLAPDAAGPTPIAPAGLAHQPPAPDQAAPRRLLEEAEDRARAEETLAAEAEARSARQVAAAQAQQEAQAREDAAAQAEAERLAGEAAARRSQAEERARVEAARAEATRRAEEEASRARQAEAAARDEAEARQLLEAELARLRAQLDADRAAHRSELEDTRARVAAEAEAVAELRVHQASQAGRAAAEEAAAEAARATEQQVEARASAALEALRARAEAEAAGRAEAEAALARLSEEADRLAAERAALVEAASAATAAAALAPPRGPRDEPSRDPSAEPEPDGAPDPLPDARQEAARRRALSLRPRHEQPAPARPGPDPEAPPADPAPAPDLTPSPPPPAPPPAELLGGALDDLTAPRLLALAARARLDGRLDVTGHSVRSLWFEGGRVVGAASGASGERVEEVALRLGLLTREQHRQVASSAAASPSRRAALLLVERGYLKPAELTGLVRRRTEEVVFGIFGEAGARFEWSPEVVPGDERVAPDRPTLALAVEGVRRRWLAQRADAVLGGPASLLAPTAAPPATAELGLSAEERRTLELADGLRTVDELLASSPLDPLSARQLLAAAVLVGALGVRVVQAGRPSAQVAEAIDLARVREKLEQVRRADYFTILGIGRGCTPHEVREAADRLLAELGPERFHGSKEAGLEARLAEIRRVVGEAREVLADDALRAEYLRGLPS